MFFGKVFGAANCPSRDMWLSVRGDFVHGAARAFVTVRPEWRERWLGCWFNGRFAEAKYADVLRDLEFALPLRPSDDIASFWLEDLGLSGDYDEATLRAIGEHARYHEALTADKIFLSCDNIDMHTLSTVYNTGGSVPSGLAITGARRNLNVAPIPDFPCRGRLNISATPTGVSGADVLIRFWAGNKLVAEGARDTTLNFTATERNGSGLTVTGQLATYLTETTKDQAWVDLKWPAAFEIHYSTSALTLPRTRQDLVSDAGRDAYFWISPSLPSGAYNVALLAVDDEGHKAAAFTVPTDSPVTVNDAPEPPTIDSVTAVAPNLTVNITAGEAGCTHTAYYSLVNAPINFGNLASGPAPVTMGLGVTTAVLPIAAYSITDNEPDFDALATAWDAAVATANTAFAVGETGFDTALDTFIASLATALDTFADALGLSLFKEKQGLAAAGQETVDSVDSVAGDLDADAWATGVGVAYGTLLAWLGTALNNTPSRYTLPNGALAGSTLGAEAVGTGDGGGTFLSTGESLYDVAQPFVKPAIVRVIVRATKGGVEELGDDETAVELNAAGETVSARPNAPFVKSLIFSGLTITAVGGIFEDGAAAGADTLELYVESGAIEPGVSTVRAEVDLDDAVMGYKQATLAYTVGVSGHYNIAVVARVGSGVTAVRSQLLAAAIRTNFISTDMPAGAANVRVGVARGRA